MTLKAELAHSAVAVLSEKWARLRCGAGPPDPDECRAAVRRQLTDRSDVYSFGVLLVELASARRPIETKREMKERLTARWAMARFIGGAAADVLDPHLARTPAAERALEMLLELAFRLLGIPRLFFHGPSCFYSLCDLQAANHGLHERIAAGGDEDKHAVPGVPVPVTVTRATAPGFLNHPATEVLRDAAMEAMRTADGFVVNTFLDLEAQFVACYEAALGKPVWVVGPLSLCNRDVESTASRGRTAAAGCQQAITAWLDGQAPGSVVFVSFGSIARKLPRQLVEVGHGLEDSGRPFLWVVKETEAAAPGVREWLEALEARTAGRGLVVRGWAPQLAVLSHRAVGGFVTHCGWNSLLESIAHGVPVATWPHFADQYLNERLVVDMLGVGVPVGVTTASVMVFDDDTVALPREGVVRAVSALMGGGEEADERRRKAREYGEKARRAMEEGGSSYENLTRLVQSFAQSEVKGPKE
ncbi:UDP-glycosyltransferase 73C4-like [Panicum virgatum]|nr:UDP-glycosyltransferase 73C4-like [Panicum virgatum]